MTESYKVSILVPIYGVEKYIERCVRSLFEQTYENIEYIFVNDCTKDRSMEILREVIKRYPTRKSQVRIIEHGRNLGLAAARNTSVGVATGEFVMHVDSDDWIEKECIEECVKKQQEKNADIVRCSYNVYFPRKILRNIHPHYQNGHDLCLAILQRHSIGNVWGTLYRRSLYIDHHIQIKEGCNMTEDFQVTPILAYYATFVESIDKYLYNYNLANQNSYTHDVSEKIILQIWTSIDVLDAFFSDKGSEFINALNCAKYKFYNEIMKKTSQKRELRKYYEDARLRSKLLPKLSKLELPLRYRIINILGNYELVRSYVKLIRTFRKNPID